MDMSMGDMGAMGGAVGGAATVITVLKYILITVGGGLALGLICGFVYAGLRYPNPNKRQMFTTVQKIIIMVIALISVGLIIFAFVNKPKPDEDMMVNGDMSMVVSGEEGALPEGSIEVSSEDGAASDGDDAESSTESSEGASDDESSSSGDSSSESESSSSAAADPTPAAPGGGGAVIIGGGGGNIMMARPMM